MPRVTASDDDMDGSYPTVVRAEWGLCAGCAHARAIPTVRGAVFVMCGKSEVDRRFVRYPVVPVRTCEGFAGAAPPGQGTAGTVE